MREKPEIKPWGYTEGKDNELRRNSTHSERLARCGSWTCIRCKSAAPAELKKCVETINPGLAPWAIQECRPCRALGHLSQSIPLLFWCGCPAQNRGKGKHIKSYTHPKLSQNLIQDGDWAEKRRLHNGLYLLDLMQQRSITQLITVVKDGTVWKGSRSLLFRTVCVMNVTKKMKFGFYFQHLIFQR